MLLAGSFGSYLAPASAVRIGLVPDISVLRIVSAGNVAGEGAKMALLSVRERADARALLEEVQLRRTLRPSRLQRPLHRPAVVPGVSCSKVALLRICRSKATLLQRVLEAGSR